MRMHTQESRTGIPKQSELQKRFPRHPSIREMKKGSNLRGKAEIPPCESHHPATTSQPPFPSSGSNQGTKRKQDQDQESQPHPQPQQKEGESESESESAIVIAIAEPSTHHRNVNDARFGRRPNMAADKPANDLLSAQPSSDSGLQVALHPLPLLEISDNITRGYQRAFRGAIVGGLLGQQNGREITVEHSFSCKAGKNEQGLYELDEEWFTARLEQSASPSLSFLHSHR